MRYSVYFFLVEPKELLDWFSRPVAPQQAVDHLKRKRPRSTKNDCDKVFETIAKLQRNELTEPAETFRFESFLWTLDLLGEPIQLSMLVNFNRYNFFSNSTLYKLLRENEPVLPVPISNSPPEVFFLPNDVFQEALQSIRDSCKGDECRAAEEEVADILESALAESVDLWGIAID